MAENANIRNAEWFRGIADQQNKEKAKYLSDELVSRILDMLQSSAEAGDYSRIIYEDDIPELFTSLNHGTGLRNLVISRLEALGFDARINDEEEIVKPHIVVSYA